VNPEKVRKESKEPHQEFRAKAEQGGQGTKQTPGGFRALYGGQILERENEKRRIVLHFRKMYSVQKLHTSRANRAKRRKGAQRGQPLPAWQTNVGKVGMYVPKTGLESTWNNEGGQKSAEPRWCRRAKGRTRWDFWNEPCGIKTLGKTDREKEGREGGRIFGSSAHQS